MKISKNNYEAFFLDYHEGNLPPAQVEELLLFLSLHPDLKEAFDDFENILLPADTVAFDNKSQLKKHTLINPENCTDFFIRYVENTLNEQEKKQLEEFLKINPAYNTDLDLFKKTKLVADRAIVFEHKAELKRIPDKRKAAIFYYWSAAASVIVFLSLYFVLQQSRNTAPTKEPVVVAVSPVDKPGSHDASPLTSPVVNPNEQQLVNKQVSKNINTEKGENNSQVMAMHKKQNFMIDKLAITAVVSSVILPDLPLEKRTKIAGLNTLNPPVFEFEPATVAKAEPAYLSLTEFASQKLNSDYPGDDDDDINDVKTVNTKKTGIAALTGKVIQSLTGVKTIIDTKRNNEGQVVAYQFSAGSFEFSRSVSK